MAELHPFESRLSAAWPPQRWQDLSIVLAISGGADSVALLRATAALKGLQSTAAGGRIWVGHFNHGLRGDEAAADQQFVERLCAQLNVSCEVGQADVQQLADEMGDGIEAAARTARYGFLQSLAEQRGARYVVTAHTANDQAETILHRIVRGTGLRGLRGMPRSRALSPAVSLLRPLLEMTREEVQGYLGELNQPYCRDASNQNTAYTRNRIRHELLPMLERDFNPTASGALLRLGQLAEEVQQTIDEVVEQQAELSVKRSDHSIIVIDCKSLSCASRYIVRETLIGQWRRQQWPLQSMGYDQWLALGTLAIGDADGSITLPSSIQAQKQDGQLTLSRPV